MSSTRCTSRDYMGLLADDTEEARFLGSTPWILDALQQSSEPIIRALRYEADRFEELPRQPSFSLLSVLRDTSPRYLREFILSARCQSYQKWQLLLIDDGSTSREHLAVARLWANRDSRIQLRSLEVPLGPSRARNQAVREATGDYLIVTDGDGVLHPMALGVFVRHINEDSKVNLVFANEAEIDQSSTNLINFLLKPPFDLFTLLRVPYVGRLYAVGRDLLEAATHGGPVFREQYDGIEEHDLLLRLALTGAVVSRHAALFTYYRRSQSKALPHLGDEEVAARRRRLAEEFVPRVYPGASWAAKVRQDPDRLASTSIWLTDLPGRERPKLLIVIPFKDQVETTIQCLESIERQQHGLDLVVALVNNRSIEHGTLPELWRWIAGRTAARYKILDHDSAFNFAKLNNVAVAQFGRDRDLILFMNNDVELSTPECLQTMAMQLLADPTSGFVGIKLYYPGGEEIQHGGVRVGPYLYGSGFYEIIHARSSDEFVDAERISLGVTFACAMARRETFEKLVGLEELFSPNAFGDVDMCLRALEAGYRNYYLGSLSAIHHESKSRGAANEDLEFSSLPDRRGGTIAAWRLRSLHRSYRHAWPLIVLPWNYPPPAPEVSPEVRVDASEAALPIELPAPVRVDASEAALPIELPAPVPVHPLRYRLADKANAALKRGLGPAHGLLRSSVTRAGGVYRRMKRPGAAYAFIRWIIKPMPLIGPASMSVVRRARMWRTRTTKYRPLIEFLRRNPTHFRQLKVAYRVGGYQGFSEESSLHVPSLRQDITSHAEWFKATRPSPELLAKLRAKRWTAKAPKITVIMPVYNVREEWLRQAIESVMAQTYPFWQLVCVNDGAPAAHVRPVLDELASRDPRVRVIHCPRNKGVSAATNVGLEASGGEYVSFMDHDDSLEPHALQRFAEVILSDRPDMLYSDEAVTTKDIDDILHITARPAFSYDYYLSHPYFVHMVCVRTDLLRRIGGLNEEMSVSQDVDAILRLIEVCRTISHIPEVLYRWREHDSSLGHQKLDKCMNMTRGALERHFDRTRQVVHFDDKTHFNFRDLRFQHAAHAKVAVLIPTQNRSNLVRTCIASLERTIDPALADFIVIDHDSDHPGTLAYLADLGKYHRVVPYRGRFNLSKILNAGVEAVRGPYTHYLFLDNDIEAIDPGWLEHMLGYGLRTDVGVVGAILLSENELVQHGGVIVGLNGSADLADRNSPFRISTSVRNHGHNGSLLASRDVSAITAACMLTRADVFHSLNGFDEDLVVEFNDVDYCLRASTLGYKIIKDAYAVLYRLQNRSRPGEAGDPHSEDRRLFRDRYRELLIKGDPFHSPMLSRFTTEICWNGMAVPGREPRARTTRVVLPSPTDGGRITRFDSRVSGDLNLRPHVGSHASLSWRQ